MIPEQAKSEIIKRRAAGETWTGIANWVLSQFGIEIHRTTIQRWYDKEIWVQEDQDSPEDSIDERIKLDKKLATYKSEADFYKKLYQKAIKDDAKKELIVEAISNLAFAFKPVSPCVYKKPTGDFIGQHPQTVVAPLTDTHIGESVNPEQMIGLNVYDFQVFNHRLYGWANQLLNLVNYRRNIAEIDNLIIPMLGDMISGDIHEELARSNISNCQHFICNRFHKLCLSGSIRIFTLCILRGFLFLR